jgi:hypothetical protein
MLPLTLAMVYTKRDYADGLKYPKPTGDKTDFCTAVFFRDVGALSDDGEDDDYHTY